MKIFVGKNLRILGNSRGITLSRFGLNVKKKDLSLINLLKMVSSQQGLSVDVNTV